MRKWILAALLALLASPAAAQTRSTNFSYLYDLDASSLTYCVLTGVGGDPWGAWLPGPGTIETSGSSTTITGVDTDADVFEFVDVGDAIYVALPNGTTYTLNVVTNADADTITVDTAVNLDIDGGYVWSWKDLTCGTAATNGWISVADAASVIMTIQFDQGDLDTLDVAWECKGGGMGAGPIRVYPGPSSDCGDGTLSTDVCQYTEGQAMAAQIEVNDFSACRIGMKYGSSDASDAGANLEQITGTVDVTLRAR